MYTIQEITNETLIAFGTCTTNVPSERCAMM